MKFKIGDIVRCIETLEPQGIGWKLGYEFKIKSRRKGGTSKNLNAYWPGINNYAVFESALGLVKPAIREEIIYE